MEWYESLENHWRKHGLFSDGQGANESVISDFEHRYSVQLPQDVRHYFQHLNGMSTLAGQDMDENGFSFLPLAQVRSVADFSVAMGWIIENEVGKDTAFIFVDYLQWSCAYAFETASANSSAVYLLGFEKPKQVAPSLKKFVDMYLANDPLLYQGAGPAKPLAM